MIIKGLVFQYCDDTTEVLSGKCSQTFLSDIQTMFYDLTDWCSKNNVMINCSKTVCLEISTAVQQPPNWSFDFIGHIVKSGEKNSNIFRYQKR